jgi:hypothetical protein
MSITNGVSLFSNLTRLIFYVIGDAYQGVSSRFSVPMCQTRLYTSGRVSYHQIGDLQLHARLRSLSPICMSYLVLAS